MTLKIKILRCSRRLFIILVSLMVTLFSEKMLISTRWIHGFMHKSLKKSWTVSIDQDFVYLSGSSRFANMAKVAWSPSQVPMHPYWWWCVGSDFIYFWDLPSHSLLSWVMQIRVSTKIKYSMTQRICSY